MNIETTTYSDGATATGTAPLPDHSPRQQEAKTACEHPPGWISCNVCGGLSDEAPSTAPVWATCPKCSNHERCEERGCVDRASTAPAPTQDKECPRCGTEEWDRVEAERGRERDVPFNRCCRCDNEWEAQ